MNVEFPDERDPIRFRYSVSDQDEVLLRRFVRSSREVVEAARRAGGLPAKLHLSYSEDSGFRVETAEPTDDQRALILHRLRPLILTNEPWSFDRVCGIVRRSSDHEFLSRHLRWLRGIYTGSEIRNMVVFSRGELVLNSDAAFQHWLNGFEYHQEEDKAAKIADGDSVLPVEVVRPIFMMLLSQKLKAISHLAFFVDKMLEQSTEMTEPSSL